MHETLLYLLLCVAVTALLSGTVLIDQGLQDPTQYDRLKQIAWGQTLARIGLTMLILIGISFLIALT